MTLVGCSSPADQTTDTESTDDTGTSDAPAAKKSAAKKNPKKPSTKDDDDLTTVTDDAGTEPEDAGGAGAKDSGGPKLSTDSGVYVPTPPAGSSITVTCSSTGFHQPSPVTISSMPPSALPRCSSATRSCASAATTEAARRACLTSDTTPSATVNGSKVDCSKCDSTQGSYCLAWACASEFSAYVCCALEKGEAACAGLLQSVSSCAATYQKPRFDACLSSLGGACFM